MTDNQDYHASLLEYVRLKMLFYCLGELAKHDLKLALETGVETFAPKPSTRHKASPAAKSRAIEAEVEQSPTHAPPDPLDGFELRIPADNNAPYVIVDKNIGYDCRFEAPTLLGVLKKAFGKQDVLDCISIVSAYPDSDNKKLILGILEDDLKRQS